MPKDPYYQLISLLGKEEMWKRKAQGETMHLAPLGYRNVHVNGRSLIEPEPATWSLVQEARALRRQGRSIREICRIMATKGLRSRRGNSLGPSSMFRLIC